MAAPRCPHRAFQGPTAVSADVPADVPDYDATDSFYFVFRVVVTFLELFAYGYRADFDYALRVFFRLDFDCIARAFLIVHLHRSGGQAPARGTCGQDPCLDHAL